MPESIDRATVEQVARLARIHLSDPQLDASAKQLGEILNYVGQLDQVELPQDVELFLERLSPSMRFARTRSNPA